MNNEDIKYISKRSRLVSLWMFLGWIVLTVVLAIYAYLFIFEPHIANHWVVYYRIQHFPVDSDYLIFLAFLVPILCIFSLVLILVILALVTKSFLTEKRYIDLIGKISGAPYKNVSK